MIEKKNMQRNTIECYSDIQRDHNFMLKKFWKLCIIVISIIFNLK